MEGWIIFGAIAAVIVAIFALSHWLEARNTEAWQQMAGELGLSYVGRDNNLVARFQQFACFRQGRKPRVHNAILGDSGEAEIVIADFRYTTGGGKHQQTNYRTLCVLSSPSLSLPQCLVRPRRKVLDLLGKMFGGQSIEVEEDPVFTAAYVAQGPDRDAVCAMLNASVRAWFLTHGDRGVHFECLGSSLVIHFGRKLAADKAPGLLKHALQAHKILTSEAGSRT